LGGTPHLDRQYTVFGEVVEGLEIVDSIADVKTDRDGKPDKDVIIIKAKISKK
jgi:cyclophilin family peptidyl-prolyl cis-trans isomerase